MTARLEGVLAPALTPFNAGLEPDVGRFIAHCRWLVDNTPGWPSSAPIPKRRRCPSPNA